MHFQAKTYKVLFAEKVEFREENHRDSMPSNFSLIRFYKQVLSKFTISTDKINVSINKTVSSLFYCPFVFYHFILQGASGFKLI